MRFYFEKGEVVMRNSVLQKAAEKIFDDFITTTPFVNNFDDSFPLIRRRLSKKINSLSPRKMILQVTGDAKNRIFINVYEEAKTPELGKRVIRKTPALSLQRLWKTYNSAISKNVENGGLPKAGSRRGYDWYSYPNMQKIQKEIFDLSNDHTDELGLISSLDKNVTRRAVANFLLQFVTSGEEIKILLKATNDTDHFVHNMAWKSLIAKLKGGKIPSLTVQLLVKRSFSLLKHPSVICRNKALVFIKEVIKKSRYRFPLPNNARLLVNEAAHSSNPIISGPANKIIKALRR